MADLPASLIASIDAQIDAFLAAHPPTEEQAMQALSPLFERPDDWLPAYNARHAERISALRADAA